MVERLPHMRGDEPLGEMYAEPIEARLPHMRGDEPPAIRAAAAISISLPHMRGDEPAGEGFVAWSLTVCPTCVGMNRVSICACENV